MSVYEPLNDLLDHIWCVCGRAKSLHPFKDVYGDCLTFRCRRKASQPDPRNNPAKEARSKCKDCG